MYTVEEIGSESLTTLQLVGCATIHTFFIRIIFGQFFCQKDEVIILSA